MNLALKNLPRSHTSVQIRWEAQISYGEPQKLLMSRFVIFTIQIGLSFPVAAGFMMSLLVIGFFLWLFIVVDPNILHRNREHTETGVRSF